MMPNDLRFSCEGVRRQPRNLADEHTCAAGAALTPSSAASAGYAGHSL